MTPRETNAAGPSTSPVRSSIDVPPDLVMGLLGSADENLRALERLLAADLHVRGNAVTLSGEPADVALAERALSELVAIVAGGQPLTPEGVRHSVAMLVGTGNESPAEVLTLDILSRRGKTIRPKTLNQKRYVDAIDAHTIVFGIGPAGTGKTYLAMAKAVSALQAKQVTRIILTRPAVEAGERLGFLPGTLSEKIDPYLRPLYDALHDMMDPEMIPKLMSSGVIEVAPLAYMRGRTLERRVHHPRRSSEHHRRTDEDVSDSVGIRLQSRCHRRYYADRPAGARQVGSARGGRYPGRHRRHSHRGVDQCRRGPPSAGLRNRRCLRATRGARAEDEPGRATGPERTQPSVTAS